MHNLIPIVAALMLAGCTTHQEQYATSAPSLRVGEVALHDGEPTIAASVADARLARRPGDTDALLLRARAEAAMQEAGPAAADFRQVLRVQPRSEEAALGLARLITPSDPAGAEALLAPLILAGSRNADVWNNLGVARDLLGRHLDAQTAYREALARDPSMRVAQVNLARSLAMTPLNAP